MTWRCCDRRICFPGPAWIMGVLNVTPDSFFDGGQFHQADAAIARAEMLLAEGADILDIGGESTRPGSAEVEEAEEVRRVIPVIREVVRRSKALVSIDTRKVAVAEAALDAGAMVINDVEANRTDPAMWQLAARTGAGYVAMHMQGKPATMQTAPVYGDVVREVSAFFAGSLDRMGEVGLGRDQVALDVGFGFGKTVEHNLQLLADFDRFRLHARPLVLGVSRKSFIGKVVGADPASARLAGSLACACWGIETGANIIRVHDVRATRDAVRMLEAVQARRRVDRPGPAQG